jgi:uncharacterized membrane protein YeiH
VVARSRLRRGRAGSVLVVGTAKALDHELGVLPSILLGAITAVGGGVIRDVLARDVPSVFKADSGLYAIPAALGSAATALLWSRDRFSAVTAICIVGSVLLVRVLAMHRGWRAPTARNGTG